MDLNNKNIERLKDAKFKLMEKWIDNIVKSLDNAGVPEYVEFTGEPVPMNSPDKRLEWYLLRRKDVSEAEKDKDYEQ